MVAYTSPDCLPYFEGTDSPCVNTGTACEPSTVWCDFAEAVEAKLDEFDTTVAVVENPPMAWVETLVPMTLTVGDLSDTPVVFDTVRADSANMVNLDENPSSITITRTGLYDVFLYCRALTDLAGANFNQLTMNIAASPALVNNVFAYTSLVCDQVVQLDNVQIAPGLHMTTYYEQGQVLSAFLNANGITADMDTTMKISMGVAWLGDIQ
jgi:hypothetical protein